MARIRDIAAVCKSKNAGPFELTIDVVFDEPALFDRVKRTGVLGPALFARLYGVRTEDVLFTFLVEACAPDRPRRGGGNPVRSRRAGLHRPYQGFCCADWQSCRRASVRHGLRQY